MRISKAYPLSIDPDIRLKARIQAGRYDWVNKNITARHFPKTSSGSVRLDSFVFVVRVGLSLRTNGILAELDRADFQPCGLDDLLAFGQYHPDVQRKFPIVGLDSVWGNRRWGIRYVVCLFGDEACRFLDLTWEDAFDWSDNVGFLAFRKACSSRGDTVRNSA